MIDTGPALFESVQWGRLCCIYAKDEKATA